MNAVEQALYSRLTGLSGLTALLATATSVYNEQAPQSAALDFVVFGLSSGVDDNDNPHRAKQLVYSIVGVSGTSMKQAGLIDAAIDAGVHHLSLTVSGWTNFLLRREQDVKFVETLPGGGRRFHRGGLYRLRIAV